jgi:S-adenosylmethionine:tRNA ribosyltransferase-isomerase
MNDSSDTPFQLSAYHFSVPAELIARYPLPNRTDSKLLVLRKSDINPIHETFSNIGNFLRAGDVLVVNNTRVIPARLHATKEETGGAVEVLLGRPESDGTFLALMQPARRMKEGTWLNFTSKTVNPNASLKGQVEEKHGLEPGVFKIRFDSDPVVFAEQNGAIPLPPYMQREAEEIDKERYQTVFASSEKSGASAAPTAGLHFSKRLMHRLEEQGVQIAEVTLQVGPGTFLPVRTDDIREHKMHFEPWELSAANAQILNRAKAEGRRIVAVGTTAMRVLESAVQSDSTQPFSEGFGITNLFIYPGYAFQAVDALITNFHLPESSLILLASAFVGKERLLGSYQEAIDASYRFFSYGDCCYFEHTPEIKE